MNSAMPSGLTGAAAASAFAGEILIADRRAPAYETLLRQALPQARLHVHRAVDTALADAQACAAPIWLGAAGITAELLRRGVAPPQWLQTTSAGIEVLFADGVPAPPRVSRAVGIFGQLMAEYALTYMLAWRRHVFAWAGAQRRGDWDGPAPGSLAGLKVLVAGVGVIGQDVARLLAPFGVRLQGVASQARDVAGFEHVHALAALPQAAAWADVVINILPDTPQTRDIFDAACFAAMPAGSLFINMGRGSAVVEPHLVQALENDHLGAAAIDVCREEPLPAAHPFWRTPRLWLTGHTAGPTLASAMAPLFCENLGRYLTGQPLHGEVSMTRGY